MNRRGFLGAILAAGVAPAVARIENLMRMVPTESGLIVPEYIGYDMAAVDDFEGRWIVFCHPSIVGELRAMGYKGLRAHENVYPGHILHIDGAWPAIIERAEVMPLKVAEPSKRMPSSLTLDLVRAGVRSLGMQ